MVGEACLPSNAYYPWMPDYTLYSGVHVCWSEHSDWSFIYGFMSLDDGLGTMTATTLIRFHGNTEAKNRKKYICKNYLLRNHMEHRAETLQKYSLYKPLQILCFSLLILKSSGLYGNLILP